MGEFLSKSEAEERVLRYILKNTPKDYSKFNPIKLETKEIAKNTNLDMEDVEDALEKLKEGSARIEEMDGTFSFWLPLDENGDNIKKRLMESNLSYYNLYLFWFISMVGLFYFSQWAISRGHINVSSNNDMWIIVGISSLIAFALAKKISNKFYLFNERLQRIKYYKVYVWVFIISLFTIIYIFNKGLQKTELAQNIILFIAILANLGTIIVSIISLVIKKR